MTVRWSAAAAEALAKNSPKDIALCVMSHPVSKGLPKSMLKDFGAIMLGLKPAGNISEETHHRVLRRVAESLLAEEI